MSLVQVTRPLMNAANDSNRVHPGQLRWTKLISEASGARFAFNPRFGDVGSNRVTSLHLRVPIASPSSFNFVPRIIHFLISESREDSSIPIFLITFKCK